MTLRDAISLLLHNFSPEERNILETTTYPGRTEEVIRYVNAALQELYGEGKPWMRKGSEGFLLYAPTTVTGTVSVGAKTLALGGSWQDWMAGCTIRINGASIDNQILGEDPDTAGQALLLFPHDGTTGSASVTVYHNSLTLPDNVLAVLRGVKVVGGTPLTAVASPTRLAPNRTNEQDYNFDKLVPNPLTYEVPAAECLGVPQLYCIDSYVPDTTSSPVFRMRVAPAPSAQTILESRVTYKAPQVDEGHLDTNLPVPHDYVQAIFLPIVSQLLTASPFFRNDSGKPEIARQYGTALKLAQTLSPQTAGTLRMSPVM